MKLFWLKGRAEADLEPRWEGTYGIFRAPLQVHDRDNGVKPHLMCEGSHGGRLGAQGHGLLGLGMYRDEHSNANVRSNSWFGETDKQ